jgi:putative tricarboxylic transport membrane protein
MKALNKDTVIAAILIAITAIFFWETFNIPKFGYASIGSEVWPRIILVPLFVLCVVYLFQSLRRKAAAEGGPGSIWAIVLRYRNPIMGFIVFLAFLATVDYLGMLIGGVLLTFGLLTALGNRSPKALLLHVAISLVAVGTVWSLFTFVLRVYMPEGEILHFY